MHRYGGRIAYEFKVQPQTGGRAVDVHLDVLTAAVLGTGEDTELDQDGDRAQTGGSGVRSAALTPSDALEFQSEFDMVNRRLVDSGESRYFVLQPGFRTVLSDGDTQLTITVLNETRMIEGVSTRVVEERQETAGVPDEVALNFFALDPATGDAFYFGEEVDMFSSGQLTGHPGAWVATDGNRRDVLRASKVQPAVYQHARNAIAVVNIAQQLAVRQRGLWWWKIVPDGPGKVIRNTGSA
jgi:hypothetical protein